jgi:hypothetical protein
MPEVIKKGKIMGFQGSWGSGIGTVLIKNSDTGRVESLTCENAPTVRAFEAAYGDIIQAGHTADFSKIKGKEIYYGPGDWVDFGWFMPVEEAPAELEEDYEKQKMSLAKKKLKKVL